MEVASIYGFQRNPQAFYDWIRPLAKQMMEAQPNPAHYALAELEQMGVLKAVITQNIDELHYRAGSKRVLELHGTVRTATCTGCQEHLETRRDVAGLRGQRANAALPVLRRAAQARRGALWRATARPRPGGSAAESEQCDVMLVAGSSLEVYPAADLPLRALQAGAQVILVNYEPTYMDARAAVVIHERRGGDPAPDCGAGAGAEKERQRRVTACVAVERLAVSLRAGDAASLEQGKA